jgi:hypothetical protein
MEWKVRNNSQRREITDMKKKTRRNASHENSDAKASQKMPNGLFDKEKQLLLCEWGIYAR